MPYLPRSSRGCKGWGLFAVPTLDECLLYMILVPVVSGGPVSRILASGMQSYDEVSDSSGITEKAPCQKVGNADLVNSYGCKALGFNKKTCGSIARKICPLPGKHQGDSQCSVSNIQTLSTTSSQVSNEGSSRSI